MSETVLDAAAMARLAKALEFICGPADPCTLALKQAAASGLERDVKKARALFMALKPSHRTAALAMLRD